jgi:hypothetical protein
MMHISESINGLRRRSGTATLSWVNDTASARALSSPAPSTMARPDSSKPSTTCALH